MGWRPQRASSFWALAIIGAGVAAGLAAGLSADPQDNQPGTTAQPSPAAIVAMRFAAAGSAPADPDVTAAVPAPAAPVPSGYVLASADTTNLFNPYPTYAISTSAAAPASSAQSDSSTVASQAAPVHAAAISAPAADMAAVKPPAATPPTAMPGRGTLPPQLANADDQIPASALAYAAPVADEATLPPGAAVTVAPPKRPAPVVHPSTPTNAVLNSAQIASIKERLKLTSYQDQLWPPVESALKEITWQRKGNAHPTIDPNSAPVQRLKSAAVPLIMSLNADQKEEVRSIVRLMGLENLAAAF
ncbi:MAG TPA: hypothetical protein VKW08_24470 [Xanthobacteraceae bacterium]|nr:hypothetical protein [Xanthobacteraceae bacterium]